MPGVGVVGNPREPAAQFDRGCKLAALMKGGANRGGVILGYGEHEQEMRWRHGAGKRLAVHVLGMPLRGFAWLKRFLFATRREQVLLAKFADTRAGLAAIAEAVQSLAALQGTVTRHADAAVGSSRRLLPAVPALRGEELHLPASSLPSAVLRRSGSAAKRPASLAADAEARASSLRW